MPAVILYSYRRCPYAMRARMALHYADIAVEIREISLRDKPAHLLKISPKGTVPVLWLPDENKIIEQSLDIMRWALIQRDADDWMFLPQQPAIAALIAENDSTFKQALDRYKYPERYPQHPQSHYQQQGALFLQKLENLLQQNGYLLRATPCMADIAIFPFVRQFAAVNADWFAQAPYPHLQAWLNGWLESALFSAIMQKYPLWLETNH